jgi:hypothetical protein
MLRAWSCKSLSLWCPRPQECQCSKSRRTPAGGWGTAALCPRLPSGGLLSGRCCLRPSLSTAPPLSQLLHVPGSAKDSLCLRWEACCLARATVSLSRLPFQKLPSPFLPGFPPKPFLEAGPTLPPVQGQCFHGWVAQALHAEPTSFYL